MKELLILPRDGDGDGDTALSHNGRDRIQEVIVCAREQEGEIKLFSGIP